jgi:gp16 family phage-associated protein
MKQRVALTSDQVKQRFRQRGLTLTQWAAEHGYNRKAVYRVLNGADKGRYGQAHEIAVKLGLKVPLEEPSTHDEARNTHARAAA